MRGENGRENGPDGSTAETFGNITMEREALTLNNLAMAKQLSKASTPADYEEVEQERRPFRLVQTLPYLLILILTLPRWPEILCFWDGIPRNTDV